MQKSPIIKNLIPGLTERGKIKIGCKGEVRHKTSGQGTYQLPQKLDHFIVTTLERGKDGNFIPDSAIHLKIGEKPKEIPITLLFDDIALNFQCRYACYNGKTLFCSGDGEVAEQLKDANKPSDGRKEVQCPCVRQEPTYTPSSGKCKINGTLSVMIDGVNSVGGIHKFRTTGYNSTVGILSSLSLIRSLTGGFLAGLPLKMIIQPKVCTSPADGSSQTVYVVGIEFAGSLADLQQKTLKIAQGNADFRVRMLKVEEDVRKLISVDASLIDEAGDITDEFYPNDNDTQPPELVTPEDENINQISEQAKVTSPKSGSKKKQDKKEKHSESAVNETTQTVPDPVQPEPPKEEVTPELVAPEDVEDLDIKI